MKKITKLQKNSYSFNYNVSHMKYIDEVNAYIALFDSFGSGKSTPIIL